MQGKKVLLVFSAFLCLLPTVTVALFAQQPDSPKTRRTASNAPKQAATASGPASKSALQSLQQRCRELLKPIEQLKHVPIIGPRGARRAAASVIWDPLFATTSEEELTNAENQFTDCVTDPPSLALRRDAFQAYYALKLTQTMRLILASNEALGKVLDQEKEKEQKEQELVDDLNKQKAAFAEAANFAVTLYKQRQEYKEAYEGEVRAYDRLSDLTDQMLALAKQAVYRSSGPSWEALVNPPKPQIIRIETPAVPRSLYCTSTTMPPAAPGLETWSWTNCRW